MRPRPPVIVFRIAENANDAIRRSKQQLRLFFRYAASRVGSALSQLFVFRIERADQRGDHFRRSDDFLRSLRCGGKVPQSGAVKKGAGRHEETFRLHFARHGTAGLCILPE
jgi:hypothetical protein